MPLGIGKSVVIDLPRDVKDVLVADPKIANAVVRSARRAYLIGVEVGQTSVFFFDAQGRQIAGFDIAVTRDLNGVRAALRQMFPNADLQVEGVGRRRRAVGHVASPLEAQQAFDVAKQVVGGGGFVGGGDKVVNGIVVKGRDQVMLKVTVAEVQRDVDQAARHRSQRHARHGHRGAQFQHRQSVQRVRPGAVGQRCTSHVRTGASSPA